MKVLLVNDYLNAGGAEKVFIDTHNLLEPLVDIEVFYGQQTPNKLRNPFEFIFSLKNKRSLYDKLCQFQPDIIHIHNFHNTLSSSIFYSIRQFQKKKSLKVVLTAHDFHLVWPDPSYGFIDKHGNYKRIDYPPNLRDFLLLRLSRKGPLYSLVKKISWLIAYKIVRVQKHLDAVIVPGLYLKKRLQEKYPTLNPLVIRNPIEFPSSEQITSPVSTGTLKLIFLGRLSYEKGLIEFIPLLKYCDTNFELDIYGEGTIKDEIAEVISKNSLTNRVRIMGKIPYHEVSNTLKNYHALVLPSIWHENAPLSLVEASFHNLRLITCNYGGMKEVAQDCGGEYLFDFTPDSIANCIKRCAVDVLDNVPMINRDIQKIRKNYSRENYTQNIFALYSRLLNNLQ